MSKFNAKLDKNGNVVSISFPKTELSMDVKYTDNDEPSSISLSVSVLPKSVKSSNGQTITIDQLSEIKISEIKMKKDENGNLSISDRNHKPWW